MKYLESAIMEMSEIYSLSRLVNDSVVSEAGEACDYSYSLSLL